MKTFIQIILPFFLIVLTGTTLSAQFAEPQLLVAPFGAVSVQVDDVNQDGKLDLVLQDFESMRWFEFDLANDYLQGRAFTFDSLFNNLSAPTIADLDGDGDADYIVQDQNNRALLWLEKVDSTGNLNYHILDEYQFGATYEFKATDINQDGLMDIIAAKSGDIPAILQYRQTSLGVFEKIVIDEEDRDFENLRLQDMDGDGDMDIVVISGQYNSRLSIFRNEDGLGGSWEHIERDDLYQSRGFEIADFNLDGIQDFAHIQCDGVFWFLGSADFQYQKIQLTNENFCTGAIAVTDVNKDGYPDIIANNDSYNLPPSKSITMSFITNTEVEEGDHMGFVFERNIVTDISGQQFVVEDFDGDGYAEFIVGRQEAHLFRFDTTTNKFDTGRLLTASAYRDYHFYDFDGDEDLDFVGLSNQDLLVLENVGDNTYNHLPKVQLPLSALSDAPGFLNTTIEMRVEDFDKNGQVDIFLLFHNAPASAYLITHEQGFDFAPANQVFEFNHTIYPTHFTDFNKDGLTDLIYGNRFNKRIEKVLNNGDGTFANPAFVVPNIIEPRALSSADVDLDGDVDILYHDNHFYWILNEGDGIGTIQSMEFIPGSSTFIGAMDLDLDGDMDFIRTYLGARSRFFFNDGNGVYDKTKVAPLDEYYLESDVDKNTAMDIISGRNILFNTNTPGDNGFSEFNVVSYTPDEYGGYNNLFLEDFNQNDESDIVFQGYYGIYLVENYWNLPTFTGTAFLDTNENGLYDSLEIGLGNIAIELSGPDGVSTTFTDTLGQFKNFSLTDGSYQIAAESLDNWTFTTDSVYSKAILNRNRHTDLLFGYSPSQIIADGKLSIATSIFRCNQPITANLTLTNTGTVTGQYLVSLTYDSLLSVQSAMPAFANHDAINRILTWQIDSLMPFKQQNISLEFRPVGTDFIGAPITLNGQLSLRDNQTNLLQDIDYTEELRCAYDPNDKLVSTTTGAGRFKVDDRLLYTIRFQNTGNDTAFNVTLTDTLDSFLDITSIEPVNASHPYVMTIKDNVLTFDFKNILLPDSLVNFEASNGFVQFEIDSKNTIQEGDKIYNKAAIFFDLNPPIITNTTEVEIAITTSIAQVESTNDFSLTVYPNPTTTTFFVENPRYNDVGNYRLFNNMGQLIWQVPKQGNMQFFDVSEQPNGLYFLQYVDVKNQQILQTKIIKQ